MEKSAVEWLEFRYKNNITLNQYDFEEAKEMEKQQIIDSFNNGWYQSNVYVLTASLRKDFQTAEQYYNETFNK